MNHESPNGSARFAGHDQNPQPLLRRSLVGEYVSLALMAHAGFGVLIWVLFSLQSPLGLLIAIAGVWIACRAGGAFSKHVSTPFVTAIMIITACMIWRRQPEDVGPSWLFSPPVFIAMLGAILLLDVSELSIARAAGLFRRWNWHRIAVYGIVVAFVSYIAAAPITMSLIEHLSPPESVMERMSLPNQITFRMMEAMTAVWFFAFGAAIGSFLNVVAYRMPRGESVVFRRSRCPYCETEIKGRDNIPILGWLLLNGRCRSCHTTISARYPIVESISAGMFTLLYFVELISGGANIPIRTPNIYSGVVWIIFYTKWDLVSLYLFHCFALSALLTWALICLDRGRIPMKAVLGVGVSLLALPALAGATGRMLHLPDAIELLPVPWSLQRIDVGLNSPELLAALTTGLVGGLAGGLLGWLAAQAIQPSAPLKASAEFKPQPGEETSLELASNASQWVGAVAAGPPHSHLISAGAIVGVSLGWQAAVVVWLIALVIRPILYPVALSWNFSDPPSTAILLAAYLIQLTSWRLLTVSWWPSIRTAPVAWACVGGAFAILWLVNRSLPEVRLPVPKRLNLELEPERKTTTPPTLAELGVPRD